MAIGPRKCARKKEQLTHGIKNARFEARYQGRSFQPPVFMLSMNKPATEDEGEVLCGNLEWSGNFRFDLEMDPSNNLKLIAGINNYMAGYVLKPDVEFTTQNLFVH